MASIKRPKYDLHRIGVTFLFGTPYYFWDQTNTKNATLKNIFFRFASPKLSEFAEVIGFNDPKEAEAIKVHNGQITKYQSVSGLIFFLAYMPIAYALVTGLISISNWLGQGLQTSEMANLLITLVLFYILLLTAVSMIYQVIEKILGQPYADTISLDSCFRLIILLDTDSVFLIHAKKSSALKLVRTLRTHMHLLSKKYMGKNDATNEWIAQHFSRADNFIEHVEKEIVAPKTDTPQKLIGELILFSKILISGNYGRLRFKQTIKKNKGQTNAGRESIWRGIWRILGTFFPLVLIVLLTLYPDWFKAFGENTKYVALVSIFWLLLGVDAVLGTGIYDRLSGIVKTIKELK